MDDLVFASGVNLLGVSESTPDVLQALQSSLAPVFLLIGIGSIMNVMMARLIWIAGKIERLEGQIEEDPTERRKQVIAHLRARQMLARRSIMFSTGAGVVISVLIALLFVSAYVSVHIGTVIAALWVATVASLIVALLFFFRESLLAARGSRAVKDQK